MKPLRDICRPLADAVAIMPYVAFQSMLDVNARAGLQNYWKSAYLGKLTDACIDTIANQASGMTSPLTQVHIQHMQGAVSRMPEDATAFSHRNALCSLNLVSKWSDPNESREAHNVDARICGGCDAILAGGLCKFPRR